ncbi:uncharacterized protein L3040_002788 [Drepanopeziza brunnea f. sp. 'multigermtubi']|uniref:uncharacterized protein n=1 Tax=Drepanopeziza brunnea f. sp. 'multigermtubi' TaxID=698441 RepID=UPI0023A0CB12|nr:hypothetical protein L3040_002788 [Drepanopeziza brunnea f. sp. 'multigermtubi']
MLRRLENLAEKALDFGKDPLDSVRVPFDRDSRSRGPKNLLVHLFSLICDEEVFRFKVDRGECLTRASSLKTRDSGYIDAVQFVGNGLAGGVAVGTS